MEHVAIQNYITLILLLGLTIQVLTGNLFEKNVVQNFKIVLILIFFLVIADVIDYYLASKSTLNNLRYVSSIIGYLLRPSIMVAFTKILLRDEKTSKLIWLPILLEGALLVTTPFTHIVFYFTEDNFFHRGLLGYLPHFVGMMYVFVFIFLALKLSKVIDKIEILTMIYMVMIIVATTILETVFGLKFIFPTTMAIACIIYYTYLYVQVYRIDGLTGLVNRKNFYIDYEKKENEFFTVVYANLNNMKKINDLEGHRRGDLAVITLVDVMKLNTEKKWRMYRLDGDEFVVLIGDKNRAIAEKFIELTKEKMKITDFSAAFGVAIHKPGDDLDIVISKAVAEMYVDKKIQKEYGTK